MFLRYPIWHMGSNGSHLSRSLHMKHLIIKVDVGSDLLQHGALWCSCQKQGLIDLQAPGSEGLQRPDPRAGCTTSSDQVRSDWTVQTLAFSIKLLLQLPQGLQETFQRTLSERAEMGCNLFFLCVFVS